MTNAMKFSQRTSHVLVMVEAATVAQDVAQISISVQDRGIGINSEDLAQLFKPYFVSTDEASRRANPNSHGIGLATCKRIAEALNGTLSVESQLGSGSTFTLKFLAH